MALKTILLNNFLGGRAKDPWSPLLGEYEFADHLDDLTRPGRLIPYSAPTADTTGQVAVGAMALSETDGLLYGLGKSTVITMYRKATDSGDWSTRANPSTFAAQQHEMLFEFQEAFYFWSGNDNSGTIGKHDIASPTEAQMDGNWAGAGTINITPQPSVGPGFHYKELDAAIFTYGSRFNYTINGTTLAGEVTLPNEAVRIRSCDEWNGYAAMGASTLSNDTYVFFYDSALNEPVFTKRISGEYLLALRNVGGELIAVCSPFSGSSRRARLHFYVFRGAEFEPIGTWSLFEGTETSGNVILPERTVKVRNGMLYFCAGLGTTAAATDYGIYRFGIQNGRYTFKRDRFATTGNTETFGADIGALEWFGDSLHVVHTANGTITRSGGSAAASAAKYRSGRLNFGAYATKKQLVEVSLTTTPLPAGETATVKISVDNGAFTTIFTHQDTGRIQTTRRPVKVASFSECRVQVDGLGAGTEIVELALTADDKMGKNKSV